MKNRIVFAAAMFLILFLNSSTYAQEQPPVQPNKNHPDPNAKPVQQTNQKDEFVKKLNDFQPKLNDLLAKAKDNTEKLPDFSKEANTLNDMVASFKGKLDKFDITPRDQQGDYASSLESDWQAIEAQYNKAQDLFSKIPDDGLEKKTEDQQKPPKQ